MEEMHERLRRARKAIYPNARLAAEAMGVKYQTYAGHENGSDGFTHVASKYAKKFNVSLDWLITGRGEGPKAREIDQRPDWVRDLKAAIELAVESGAGAGEVGAVVTDSLISALPGRLQLLDADGQRREQIAEAIVEKSGVPRRKKKNGDSADTQKRGSAPTSPTDSKRSSRNP